MPWYVSLLIFHPLWVTLLVLIGLVFLFRWTGSWARYRYPILAALFLAYAIDAGFALQRIWFAQSLPKEPVIAQQIPLPRRLVLVDFLCTARCHDWLISGAVDEIISVSLPRVGRNATNVVRYRAGWSAPGACPSERQRANYLPSEAQRSSGYCPKVEPADVPTEGIFLVEERMIVAASDRARPYAPSYLVKTPPGRVIHFAGLEVQNRNPTGITVLASAYTYEAPGFLLPVLFGCWGRPDNVIWIMPPGDTGCGVWRWFTWGGNERSAVDHPNWLFERVFTPPDRAVLAPKRS
jgi:hypothetical protein